MFYSSEDPHPLLSVLRYVERNPVRATLVARAEDWPWSSLGWHLDPGSRPDWVGPAWLDRPSGWLRYVNAPPGEPELTALRRSVQRGTPLGSDRWVDRVAKLLGLAHTLRPLGRPRKDQPNAPKK